jgi:dolichol-phosphate mannosyltransferase
MALNDNLREMERVREAYWLRYGRTASIRLRWRANTVRHCFHVLPQESILEIGAGSGLWTEHLSYVLHGECPITALTFNADLAERARQKRMPNVSIVEANNFPAELSSQQFDYIVGTAILCHDQYAFHLSILYDLLKPGGQIFFFEANFWNPQVFIKSIFPPIGRLAGNASCQVGIRKYRLMKIASHQGFTNIEVLPFDIVHPRTPARMIRTLQSAAFIIEHAPAVRELCGSLCIWAKRPGDRRTYIRKGGLASHPSLFGGVSVVLPCHNESMNIQPLIARLTELYDPYIKEVLIVNDNSTDRTQEVALELSRCDPRIRIINRTPPNGVGRALRDGYAAATGEYILTMDADFVHILPELRDLFDVVAAGHEGAIGSRFSYDSVLLNYPFLKILCNRAFHLLVKLFLIPRVRDISNNLKLFRAAILKNLDIQESGFAANVETGLKPILMGYDIKETPISWINRTVGMGKSSFRITKVAPNYFMALIRIIWTSRRNLESLRQAGEEKSDTKRAVIAHSKLRE